MIALMHIGELAHRTRVSAKTIRYYETIGILPPAKRTASGYRVYHGDTVTRLGFVRKAKALGLTLAEIHEILAARDRGESPCPYVQHLLDQKIVELERRISGLYALRNSLRAARQVGASFPQPVVSSACVCHIIEQHPQTSLIPASVPH